MYCFLKFQNVPWYLGSVVNNVEVFQTYECKATIGTALNLCKNFGNLSGK